MDVTTFLSKRRTLIFMILGLLSASLVWYVDFITGYEISFSIFYLIPIFIVTWFTNRWLGVLMCIASAIGWLEADLISGQVYSHPAIPYWNMSVRLGFFLIISFLGSKLKSVLDKESTLARSDYLTEVANSRYFYGLASMEINRSGRNNRPLTFAYIDIDNFKQINDQAGHSAGDSLLRLVASAIKNNIRLTDIVARLGGDEFGILLPETDYVTAQQVLKRLHDRLSDIVQINNLKVTLSIGSVTFSKLPGSVDEIIKKADELMYTVKISGKNRVEFMDIK